MSFKLLDDEPSVHDEFGAHARIATTIKETVESNDGGKVIALIGDWGAGKSTTISLLQGMLTDNEIRIFTYDTWVHSGDHLRKSFLNELIDFLLNQRLLQDPHDWYQKKEVLAGRLRVTEKSVSQKLTAQAKWLLPIIFLLPVSSTIITTLGPGYVQDQYFFNHYPFYIFAFTLIASIVLLAPVGYLIWFWIIRRQSDEVLSVIANKAVHKEETTSIESPEATTLEFQEIFRAVMKDAFKEGRNKLIIVLDNLDRLDDSEAKTVWSLLRGFIDNPNYKKNSDDDWIKKLWVIVPWAAVPQKESTYFDSHSEELTSNASNIRESHFLEKVFQVRFYLPPVVHSDWKKNLIRLLRTTFGKIDEQELKAISRLFEAYIFEASEPKSPTPREIKLFINDLATLALMWKQKDKLSFYAAYVLTRRLQKNELLSQLRVGRAVSPSFKRILKEDPSKRFASYFFNIDDIKKANAMLLKLDVELDLQKVNHDWKTYDLKDNPALIEILELIIEMTLPSWIEDRTDSFFTGLINLCDLIEQNLKIAGTSNEDLNSLDGVKNLTILSGIDVFENYFTYFPYDLGKSAVAAIKLSKIDDSNRVVDTVIKSLLKIDILGDQDSNQKKREYSYTDDKSDILGSLKKLYSENQYKSAFDQFKNNHIKIHIPLLDWLDFCKEFSKDNNLLRVIHPSSLSGVNANHEKIRELFSSVDYDNKFLNFIRREVNFGDDSMIVEIVLNKIRALIDHMSSDTAWLTMKTDQAHIVLRDLLFLKCAGNIKAGELLDVIGSGKLIIRLLSRSVQNSRNNSFPAFILTSLITNPTSEFVGQESEDRQAQYLIESSFRPENSLKSLAELAKFISVYELDGLYANENIINGVYGRLLLEHKD